MYDGQVMLPEMLPTRRSRSITHYLPKKKKRRRSITLKLVLDNSLLKVTSAVITAYDE